MPPRARARTKSNPAQPGQDGFETKEQRRARIAANREAQELATRYVLPVVAGLAVLFVVGMFMAFGFGQKKVES